MTFVLTEVKAKSIIDLLCNYDSSLFYDEKLPLHKLNIIIEDMYPEAGYCIPDEDSDEYEMGLISDTGTYKAAVNLIAHELVHLVQMHKNQEVGHNTPIWYFYINKAKQQDIII